LKARAVWNLMIMMAWKNGEPGIIFLDTINKHNPTPNLGQIESTNPCGEQPLLPYESCNLGSIDVSKFVSEDGKMDWNRLKEAVRWGVRFLDNVIDANVYTLPEIETITKGNRKIGLGVMGFADMLIKMGIRYDTEEGLQNGEKLMEFITTEARRASVELGEERGNFPNFRGSTSEKRFKTMRNATVTTIAPTGTISIIAGCSQGIEPIFAIVYVREVAESLGRSLIEINPLFESVALEEGFYDEELIKKIAKKTSIQDVDEVPERARRLFVAAHDISAEWHVRMQAAFQKHTDNAVSKTINFPNKATPDDIDKAYQLAYKLGCKGVTVYRHGSREKQVLRPVESEGTLADYSLECPTCA
ncbi:MAG: adenosylcobalamin-dependent ribonucleoside-diphosphate reductase, partial [Candidatus Bathyarchaeota archaeon]|nr:adenosylcobalamin-dependent ribonucleoside-diphosphate reductase [Candidatus Bathyarchaeota archaeon]